MFRLLVHCASNTTGNIVLKWYPFSNVTSRLNAIYSRHHTIGCLLKHWLRVVFRLSDSLGSWR